MQSSSSTLHESISLLTCTCLDFQTRCPFCKHAFNALNNLGLTCCTLLQEGKCTFAKEELGHKVLKCTQLENHKGKGKKKSEGEKKDEDEKKDNHKNPW